MKKGCIKLFWLQRFLKRTSRILRVLLNGSCRHTAENLKRIPLAAHCSQQSAVSCNCRNSKCNSVCCFYSHIPWSLNGIPFKDYILLYAFEPSSSHISWVCVSVLPSTHLHLLAGHWLQQCAILSSFCSLLNPGHQAYTPLLRKMSQTTPVWYSLLPCSLQQNIGIWLCIESSPLIRVVLCTPPLQSFPDLSTCRIKQILKLIN